MTIRKKQKTVAQRLRKFRFDYSLSQYHVSLQTGIQQCRISLIERGLIKPSARETRLLKLLLSAVGVL